MLCFFFANTSVCVPTQGEMDWEIALAASYAWSPSLVYHLTDICTSMMEWAARGKDKWPRVGVDEARKKVWGWTMRTSSFVKDTFMIYILRCCHKTTISWPHHGTQKKILLALHELYVPLVVLLLGSSQTDVLWKCRVDRVLYKTVPKELLTAFYLTLALIWDVEDQDGGCPLLNTEWWHRSGNVFHILFLLLLKNNLNVAVLGTLAWFSSVCSSNLTYRIHMLPWSLAQIILTLYTGLVPTKKSEWVGTCLSLWEFLVPDVDQKYQQPGPSTFYLRPWHLW